MMTPVLTAMPIPMVVPSLILPPMLLASVQTVMQPMVPMMDTLSRDHAMRLGASLRDRATLPSPLRGLGPSGGYPSRLRSLTLTARSACPAARCAHRRCRAGTLASRFDRIVRSPVASSSRRRCAPRSSRCSPRSPWPAAPAAGIASARRRNTPCVAGVGFAVHRLAHRAVQSRPHKCGQRRRRLPPRAPHVLVQHPLHIPPLTRRGGSDEPPSPAPISRTLMLHDLAVPTAGAALGLTPDASLMQRALRLPMIAIGWLCRGLVRPCRRLACRKHLPPIGARRRASITSRDRSIAPMPRRAPFGIPPCCGRFS